MLVSTRSHRAIPPRGYDISGTRHFTATGFVVHDGRVLLHWHRKVRAWLPPGGHINPDEDPVQAVVREIEEESGLRAAVVGTGPSLAMDYPEQVQPPYTILIEDIDDPVDGFHQHIDMIYFCRPAEPPAPTRDGWVWVAADELRNAAPVTGGIGPAVAPPQDVRLLAMEALRVVGAAG